MLNITIGEMQIKTTMRYHLTPVRMAVIKKSISINAGWVWRNENPRTLLVGMQTSTATMENSVDISLKLEIELPYNPATPLLGLHTEETRIERDTFIPNIHCSTVYNN